MTTEPRAMPGPFSGLSVKLIATITLVILAVEVVIYLPSAGNFREAWLNDRLRVGIVAARVLDAVPDAMNLPAMLTDNLLNSAGAIALVYRRNGQSQLIELDEKQMPREAITADMRKTDYPTLIMGALDTLTHGGERTLRIVGSSDGGDPTSEVEVLMSEAPLHDALVAYSWNIVFISLIIAVLTAGVLYVLVSRLLIDPIRRLTGNMVAYRSAPENAALIIAPPRRKDEIGIVEKELAAMENDIFTMLRQRRHLADLGLAVAKINHDLRNTLPSAQLLSDQVVALDAPKIQRLAPRLLHSIDKAVAFAESVLAYGLQLSIADNGPGLPPRARDNLFVAFEGSAKTGGTGLGLAIARELVAAHGGTLSYVPLDPGTRFDIRLPAALRLA